MSSANAEPPTSAECSPPRATTRTESRRRAAGSTLGCGRYLPHVQAFVLGVVDSIPHEHEEMSLPEHHVHDRTPSSTPIYETLTNGD